MVEEKEAPNVWLILSEGPLEFWYELPILAELLEAELLEAEESFSSPDSSYFYFLKTVRPANLKQQLSVLGLVKLIKWAVQIMAPLMLRLHT